MTESSKYKLSFWHGIFVVPTMFLIVIGAVAGMIMYPFILGFKGGLKEAAKFWGEPKKDNHFLDSR